MRIRSLISTALLASVAVTSAASAQTYSEQRRWDQAQARYRAETDLYQRERDRYFAARARDSRGDRYDDRRYGDRGYGAPPPPPPGGDYGDRDRFATDYDAARDYRADQRYQERRLSADDEVYRGSDGRYYCKRNDGTTGLIVGGALGGVLGNVIDGGRQRTAGTLIGGALGALTGRSIDQNNDVRCR